MNKKLQEWRAKMRAMVLGELWKLVGEFHTRFLGLLVLTIVFMCFTVAKSYTLPLLLRLYKAHATPWQWFLAGLGILVFYSIFLFLGCLRVWHSSRVNNEIFAYIKLHVAKFLLNMPVPWHKRQHSGQMLAKVNHSVEKVHTLFDRVIWEFGPTSIQALLSLSLLFYFSWRSAVIVLLAMVGFIYVSYKAFKFRQPRRERRHDEYEKEWSLFSELIRGVSTVYAFGQRQRMFRRYQGVHNRILDYLKIEVYPIIFRYDPVRKGILLFFGEMGLFAVWIYQIYQGTISEPDLMYVFLLTQIMFNSFWQFAELIEKVSEATTATEQLFKVLRQKSHMLERTEVKDFQIPTTFPIEFDKVAFSYNGSDNILSDVSFKVQPGEFIGIVGPTGAGKSTLIELLLRFNDPVAGQIKVGGIPLQEWPRELRERLFSVVLQDGHVFPESIAANIAFGNPSAAFDKIEQSARLAAFHNDIAGLPHGYKTMLGERGVTLSGGQRQRLLIARAMLADYPIYVLDEPTSALDSVTEEAFMDGLNTIRQSGATVIVVAHRIATILNATKILALKDGKVVGFAPHRELVKTCPLYRQMVGIQLGMHAVA